MNINLIGAPLNYGCDKDGTQLSPKRLRENKIINIIEKNNHSVYDTGDIFIPFVAEKDKHKDHSKMKFLNTVASVNTNLANNVYSSLQTDRLPFVMGGDHSVALGSIAGASKFFNEIAVIWIDAHADINTDKTSPSGNIHGMPLSASIDIGHPTLRTIFFKEQKVKPENIYIIGARKMDLGEYKIIEEHKIPLYTMDDTREKGLNNVIQEVIDNIKSSNVDGVHLSFDIDALDPSLVPGTGTPVANGFTMEEGKLLFTGFLREKFITSMDFVEFNPKIDKKDNRTTKNCMEMLEHIFKSF